MYISTIMHLKNAVFLLLFVTYNLLKILRNYTHLLWWNVTPRKLWTIWFQKYYYCISTQLANWCSLYLYGYTTYLQSALLRYIILYFQHTFCFYIIFNYHYFPTFNIITISCFLFPVSCLSSTSISLSFNTDFFPVAFLLLCIIFCAIVPNHVNTFTSYLSYVLLSTLSPLLSPVHLPIFWL